MGMHFTRIFTSFFIFWSVVSCGPVKQQQAESETKQAALACIVTGPAAPVCAVTVTGAQWLITILVAGAVVGTVAVVSNSNQVTTTYGDYRVFAKRDTVFHASCNVAGNAPHCQGLRVQGTGSTCNDAKHDATQKAPRGCYARHCQCKS